MAVPSEKQPITFTRAQLTTISNALVDIYEAINQAMGAEIVEEPAPQPAPQPATHATQTRPAGAAPSKDANEDSPKGEMARRWMEFCEEHHIHPTKASQLLAQSRGHYKNAMRLYESQPHSA